jgi:hypothetical protein
MTEPSAALLPPYLRRSTRSPFEQSETVKPFRASYMNSEDNATHPGICTFPKTERPIPHSNARLTTEERYLRTKRAFLASIVNPQMQLIYPINKTQKPFRLLHRPWRRKCVVRENETYILKRRSSKHHEWWMVERATY